jgi:hypothetical protein
MVKFKIGFIIDAETMFSMLSKFLPVDQLTVEEMAPAQHTPRIVAQVAPNKSKQIRTRPPNLKGGINRIILEALADGQSHTAASLEPLLIKAGFSRNSASSRLQSLKANGLVRRTGTGTWALVEQLKATG